jgi:hypothetical protein
MMVFANRYVLPGLLAVGLSIPQGVSNLFLPSVKVSSIYDVQDVRLPLISFQTLLIFLYIIFLFENAIISWRHTILVVILFFFGFVGAFYSLSPGGYLSYSLLWCIFPFAAILHAHSLNGGYTAESLIFDVRFIGVAYLPFYLFDIGISMVYFGLQDFSSFMLASNGHSFVSFLFSFVFLSNFFAYSNVRNARLEIDLIFGIVYLIGGMISAGRVSFMAFVFCLFVTSPRKMFKFCLFASPLFLILLTSIGKFQLLIELIFNEDYSDFRIWSSGVSRLDFWASYFEMFLDNILAGAGGLAGNAVKYDYGFPYDVFVDPHNELLFVLSGFGVMGVGFIFTSLLLVFAIGRDRRFCALSHSQTRDYSLRPILSYIFICSVSNANSAKQNIQVFIIFILMMAVYGAANTRRF